MGKAIAEKPVEGEIADNMPATTVAEYQQFADEAAALKQQYGHIPDPSTTDGYRNIVEGLKAIKKPRVDLEKLRKALKAPALLRAQQIDSEARRIKLEFEALEEPLKLAKQEFDTRNERAQREELDTLLVIGEYKTAKEATEALEGFKAIAIEDYYEIISEAADKKRSVITDMECLIANLADTERREAERLAELAEMEAQRKEIEAARAKQEAEAKAERERIAEENAKAEKERAERAEADRIERERLAAEQAEARAKQEAADKIERERVAAEQEKQRQALAAERAEIEAAQAKADAEAKAKLEAEAKAEKALKAKSNADAIKKMRARLAKVDWDKPSDAQINAVWAALQEKK